MAQYSVATGTAIEAARKVDRLKTRLDKAEQELRVALVHVPEAERGDYANETKDFH